MPQSDKSSAEQAKSRLRKVMSKSDDPVLNEQEENQIDESMSVAARAKSRLRQVMGKTPSDDADGTVAQSKAEAKAKVQAEREAKAAAKQMAKLKAQAEREAKAEAKAVAKEEAARAKAAKTAKAMDAKAAKAATAAKDSMAKAEPELVECEVVDGDELKGESRSFAKKISDGAGQIKDHISAGFTKKVKQVKRKKDEDAVDLKDREANAIDADAMSADPVVPDYRALVVVYTPEELNAAQKQGAERILVKGELGKKLQTAFKGLRSLSSASFNTLALAMSGAALFAPFTGGVSLGAAGTVMGTVGAALTATAIAAISAIGLALVIAVFKGYEEVRLGGGGLELVIKKGKGKGKDAQADAVHDEATDATAK